jgi:hypothetical protein
VASPVLPSAARRVPLCRGGHPFLTPILVAAGVSVPTNWWLQRLRADLHMIVGSQSLDDADRLLRANNGDTKMANHPHWLPLYFRWVEACQQVW